MRGAMHACTVACSLRRRKQSHGTQVQNDTCVGKHCHSDNMPHSQSAAEGLQHAPLPSPPPRPMPHAPPPQTHTHTHLCCDEVDAVLDLLGCCTHQGGLDAALVAAASTAQHSTAQHNQHSKHQATSPTITNWCAVNAKLVTLHIVMAQCLHAAHDPAAKRALEQGTKILLPPHKPCFMVHIVVEQPQHKQQLDGSAHVKMTIL